ncbi:alpha-galactosidase [Carnobacterium gallinarum]|uniref:alpha-galactosidase n=1 Tax=Carnobacterium gallinarum TaxID=2749 RepID=UPI000550CB11|nr:alpha-galactosidase [Carnobacterium gallinarum]
MGIYYDQEKQQFHLFNKEISYVMELENQDYLIQVYFGARIQSFYQKSPYPKIDRSSFSPNPANWPDRNFSLDTVLQECPGQGSGDYREPLFEITYPDGTKATQFKYEAHEIIQGKPKLTGLPATYAVDSEEAETLVIHLIDSIRQVKASLSYTIYQNRSVVTKSIQYENLGTETVYLNRGLSACLDFPDAHFDLVQMPGAWSREKQLKRDPLMMGIHTLDSKRGASSTHQQPFIALMRPEATEKSGEVYGFHFIYSGNFQITTEVDTYQQTRVLIGINAYDFSWQLQEKEVFQTPEVVLVYSNTGLNGMSQTFHHLYRERLARGEHQFKERPVLINNWETTYFDFDETQLVNLARKANELGIELFVLDDGWFGERNDDTTSLGDWVVNRQKLANGLKGVADKIRNEGLKFGLWFEPEMISQQSQLFKEHPDWHIQIKDYPTSQGRNQLVLDFSRQEVRDEIKAQLIQILSTVPIDYIKWDMNRNMTEVGSLGANPQQQLETAHRYILGLYEVLEELTTSFPHILFENCSGGGGRYDPGMVYYMPQSWASDNTDAVERLKIQYGTSLVFPPIMTCAHLSESPNHQVGRITDTKMRADVAMSANLGIMLNLEKEATTDLELVKENIAWYQKNRKLLQFGDFYRLISPFESHYTAWVFVDAAKDQAILFFYQILNEVSKPFVKVQLQGLDSQKVYQINGDLFSGDELMNFGLYLNHDLDGDFKSKVIELKSL